MFKYILLSIFSFSLLSFSQALAQTTEPVQMADVMRSNGKIYVVVAVIVTLFLGLIAYLIRLDIKISRLEKEDE